QGQTDGLAFRGRGKRRKETVETGRSSPETASNPRGFRSAKPNSEIVPWSTPCISAKGDRTSVTLRLVARLLGLGLFDCSGWGPLRLTRVVPWFDHVDSRIGGGFFGSRPQGSRRG